MASQSSLLNCDRSTGVKDIGLFHKLRTHTFQWLVGSSVGV